jgi:hypothetical protein
LVYIRTSGLSGTMLVQSEAGDGRNSESEHDAFSDGEFEEISSGWIREAISLDNIRDDLCEEGKSGGI